MTRKEGLLVCQTSCFPNGDLRQAVRDPQQEWTGGAPALTILPQPQFLQKQDPFSQLQRPPSRVIVNTLLRHLFEVDYLSEGQKTRFTWGNFQIDHSKEDIYVTES